MSKVKIGDTITINIPFTYTLGEEGYYTGKVLETIEDCKAEVLAEIEADVLKDNEVFFDINTEQ